MPQRSDDCPLCERPGTLPVVIPSTSRQSDAGLAYALNDFIQGLRLRVAAVNLANRPQNSLPHRANHDIKVGANELIPTPIVDTLVALPSRPTRWSRT